MSGVFTRYEWDDIRSAYAEQSKPGKTDLYLGIVNRCNARCPFCPQSEKPFLREKLVAIPESVLAAFIEICRQLALPLRVDIGFQSEPTLLPEQLLAAAKRMNQELDGRLILRMTSNGQALTPELVDGLVGAGLREYRISLNAASKEVHDRLMPGTSWDVVTRHVDSLYERFERREIALTLNFTLMNANRSDLAAFRALWPQVPKRVEYLQGWSTVAAEELDAEAARRALLARRGCPLAPLPQSVYPNGQLSLCGFVWGKEYQIGSIAEVPFPDLFSRYRFYKTQLNRSIADGNVSSAACSRCTAFLAIDQKLGRRPGTT